MVLCLICWGVYAGVKKAHETVQDRKEKKRIKNLEKSGAGASSDEKAILAAAAASSADECTCSSDDPESHKMCQACKNAALAAEEVPPPYTAAVGTSSRAVA